MIRISRYMYISHLLTLMVTRELAVCFDQYKLITCIYFTISVIINPLCLAPKVMVKKKIHFNFSNLYSCERVLILFFGLPDLLWSLKYFQACCRILILHCSYTDSVQNFDQAEKETRATLKR